MAAIAKLDEATLQALCDVLGATDTGLTGIPLQGMLRVVPVSIRNACRELAEIR